MKTTCAKLMRCVAVTLTFCLPHSIASQPTTAGDPPPPALLWNRSGLPAVFPLQVKTVPGQDFILTLIDAETGQEAIAARIVGGTFFRVLIPPGRYRLRFSDGNDPDDTSRETFELTDILEFRVIGFSVKAGHLIDITTRADNKAARAQIKRQSICQRFALTDIETSADQHRNGIPKLTDAWLLHERLRPSGTRLSPPPNIEWLPTYRYELQSRFCD